MKVMVNRKGDVYQIYVAKKDLEEPIVESEKPGLWGGWVRLGNGWRLELPEMALFRVETIGALRQLLVRLLAGLWIEYERNT